MTPSKKTGLLALVSTFAAVAGVAFGMAVPIATALAAPSTHQSIEVAEFACAHLAVGDAQAYFAPFLRSVSGAVTDADAGLQLWIEPDDIITDPPTFVSGGADLVVGGADSGLSGTFEIVSTDGQRVVGIGYLDAHFTPNGGVIEGGPPRSTGNEKLRAVLLTQPMTVTGTVTLDLTALGRQIVLSLDGCSGTTVDIDVFTNAPASSVTSFQIKVLSCVVATDDVVLQLYATDDLGLVSADGVVQTATANYPFTVTDGVTLTLSSFAMSTPLEAVPGGGEGLDGAPGGTLDASAELSKQPKVAWTEESDGTTFRFVQQNLSVSGAIVAAFDDGTAFTLPMDDATCYGFDFGMRTTTMP